MIGNRKKREKTQRKCESLNHEEIVQQMLLKTTRALVVMKPRKKEALCFHHLFSNVCTAAEVKKEEFIA